MEEFYLLIAGSRTFNDKALLCRTADSMLSTKVEEGCAIHIVEGEARGADTLARDYAQDRGYALHKFPAQWDTLGKRAGYARNRQMHEFIAQFPGRGCLLFWDGESRGTAHNFGLCREFGTQMRVFNYKTGTFVKPE